MIRNITEFIDNLTITKVLTNRLDDEDITWITINGRHIPIKEGQSREDAISSAFGKSKSIGAGRGHLDVKKEIPYSTKIEYVMKDVGFDKKKADDTVRAVESFTGMGYLNIRSVQTGSLPVADIGYKEQAEIIEEYIKKAPHFNQPIYRGLHPTKGSNLLKFVDVKVGDVVDMKGTSSWTSSKESGQKNAISGVLFRAESVNKGTSVKHLSAFPSEDEVLVSKDAKFRVTGKQWIYPTIGGKILSFDVEET